MPKRRIRISHPLRLAIVADLEDLERSLRRLANESKKINRVSFSIDTVIIDS